MEFLKCAIVSGLCRSGHIYPAFIWIMAIHSFVHYTDIFPVLQTGLRHTCTVVCCAAQKTRHTQYNWQEKQS